MRWREYPAYKDSGIQWLGKIPEHWETRRLKYLASLNDENLGENTDPDCEVIYVDIGSIDTFDGIQSKTLLRFGDAPSRARRIVRHGDVIVSTVRTYLRAITPIVNPEMNLIVSTGFAVIRPNNKLDSNFASYVLRAPYFVETVVANSVGVSYPAINASDLISFYIVLPSKVEQRTIAAFLDHKLIHLDALMARKEQQIELLREKRDAVISHAVTKGLNTNVPMEDTGIEWLGKIPKYWDVQKLKYIASTRFSNVDKHTNEGERPVRLCNYVDVYYNDYITADLDFMEATAKPIEIAKFELKKGNVIVTKDSETWDDIAVPAYVSTDFNGVLCGYHLAQIHPNSELIDGKYLFWSFSVRGINDQFRIAATGVTRYGLGKHDLDNALFLVPPMQEQRAIATFLDHESAHIDALISKIRVSIEKLREYRMALISAVVTGKIDVRKEVS